MTMLMKNKQRGICPLHLALYQSSALSHTETPEQLVGAYKAKPGLYWSTQQMLTLTS